MVYYIFEKDIDNTNAAQKAPKDVEYVCRHSGYSGLQFHKGGSERKTDKVRDVMLCELDWAKAMHRLHRGDIVIYKYPMACMPVSIQMVSRLKNKGIKLIAFVHDINSIRFNTGGYSNSKLEFYKKCDMALDQFDAVICHNEKMRSLMISREMVKDKNKIIVLEVFDYICKDNEREVNTTYDKSIVVAGNLSRKKSNFIYELNDIKLHLYGNNYSPDEGKTNREYKGIFDANVLPEKIEGGFGLVWDGDSVETCKGAHGDYLRYNNPHKLSLYLASNMPVIIWKDAACAEFVEKYNVGLTIDSLRNLGEMIESISMEQYRIIQKNARNMGKKIRGGYFSKKAINRGLDLINERR